MSFDLVSLHQTFEYKGQQKMFQNEIGEDFASLASWIQQYSEQDEALPLDQWNPKFCGKINIRIDQLGAWYHEGSEIKRIALIQLFAKVLCYENGEYYLKTPVEKLQIQVEDAPLIIAEIFVSPAEKDGDQVIFAKTNLGQVVQINLERPILVDLAQSKPDFQPTPYVALNHGVLAKFSRPAYYNICDFMIKRQNQVVTVWGVESCPVDGKEFEGARDTIALIKRVLSE